MEHRASALGVQSRPCPPGFIIPSPLVPCHMSKTHSHGISSLKGFGASCLLGAELIDDLFLEKNNTVWV